MSGGSALLFVEHALFNLGEQIEAGFENAISDRLHQPGFTELHQADLARYSEREGGAMDQRRIMKWTQADIDLLEELLARRTPHEEIAGRLNRSVRSIVSRHYYMSSGHRYRAALRKKYDAKKPYCVTDERLEIGPSDQMWDERLTRVNTPHRDLTGQLCGDPLQGYSALDRYISIGKP